MGTHSAPIFSALRPGDRIGVVALASPSEKQRLQRGVRYLESLGFEVQVALDPSKAYRRSTYLFGSDSARRRALALNKMFSDKRIAAIIASRGGYSSMELLPYLDYKLISRNPKPLVGLSDITAVLSAVNRHSHIPVVHGATIESAFSKAHEFPKARRSAAALLELLSAKAQPFAQHKALKLACGPRRKISGRLTGGNLTLLCSLLGTPWEPDFSGAILCLEDIREKPHRLHRMLLQMRLAGKFKALKGVILGDFTECKDTRRGAPQPGQVFRDIFADLRIPVWSGLPFGHELLNLPVPLGVEAVIEGGRIACKQVLFGR